MNEKITKREALFFMDQCVGETAGSMAMIPNNPLFMSLFCCYTGKARDIDVAKFSACLRQIADALEEDKT